MDHRYPVGLAFILYHRTLGSILGDGVRGQNLVHLQKVVFLCLSFLEVYIFATTYQKAFILGPKVPRRVSFHSMPSDSWVHVGGWGQRSNSSTSSKSSIAVLEFSRSLYLCNHLSESIHTWTKGTPNPTLPYPTPPHRPTPPHPYPTLPNPPHSYPTPTSRYLS